MGVAPRYWKYSTFEPTFLYELIWNLSLFVFLGWLRNTGRVRPPASVGTFCKNMVCPREARWRSGLTPLYGCAPIPPLPARLPSCGRPNVGLPGAGTRGTAQDVCASGRISVPAAPIGGA